jgi:Zn-dependent protease
MSMNTGFGSVNIPVFIVVLLLSVAFHEAMHAFTSHWLGDTTAKEQGRLTLNPLKHLDLTTSIILPIVLILAGLPPFFAAKPVPFNPNNVKYEEFGAALIGLAGPLTNFVLAAAVSLFLRQTAASLSNGVLEALLTFVKVNVALFVFNLITFPPLDGSRLLYAFAPEPLQRIMYQIESGGFLTIMIFIFLLFPILSPIITTINTHILTFLLI